MRRTGSRWTTHSLPDSVRGMFPRVDGLRALELGDAGGIRGTLNALVLQGRKTATLGLLEEYAEEGEQLEHVGERLVLVDDDGRRIGLVEITDVRPTTFGDVPWEFVAAEGEGDESLEEWREGHLRFWARMGRQVDFDTQVVELRLRPLDGTGEPEPA